ncbi:hypothetical protein [Lishizhenia sp.]|uniref:hypothetical protein n=1 Tax=Lishizhenia sp. TaxID=2497594 RepID=UPI00299EB4C6|nr:hypothetical protein [Lishizhenia sp.]MDX1445848.1 hypothetical protein [Lishizhenia sp.]
MKIKLLLASMALSLGVTAQTTFGNDLMRRPISARAAGLGNAYTAVVNDASAMYWNPGALGMLRYSSINISGWMGKNLTSLSETSYGSVYGFEDATVESKMKFGFNEFSVAVPIPFDTYSDFYVVPSFSRRESANVGAFEELWTIERQDDNFTTATETIQFVQGGGRKETSFGLGFGIGENIGLGFTYNVYGGELDYYMNQKFEYGFESSEDEFTEAYMYSGAYYSFGFRASTQDASDSEFDLYEDYGEGVDFGFTLTFPHQRQTMYTNDLQGEMTVFTTEPARITSGLAFRLTDNLWCLDMSYVDYSNDFTVYKQGPMGHMVAPNSNSFDNMLTLSMGYEYYKMFRLGLMGRNYQYRDEDGFQPWTATITTGFTANFSETVVWDVTGQFEIFNREEFIDYGDGETLDYKGAVFNLFSTLRIIIPY